MAFVTEEVRYPSANGRDTITAQLWQESEHPPVAVVQIIHGMNEYMGRYVDFARFLTAHGFAVFGNDHLGHGKSKGADGYGYFADRGGSVALIEDVRTLNRHMSQKFPGLPVILLGHSMGSFICRSYISRYGDGLAGVILSGTAGPNLLSGIGLFLSRAIMLTRGKKHPSPFLSSLAFGHYNDRYPEHRSKYDWVTRDTALVDRYAADEMCTFDFTAGAYHDMLCLLTQISSKKWAQTIPTRTPYLLFSGSMDPVGGFGRGVKLVADRMKAAGAGSLTLKLYEGGRHEMLNDTERDSVYQDVLAWMEAVIGSEKATGKAGA